MAEHQIRVTDGAGYERMMGLWSRPVGEVFLDWLKPESGLAWADIGCGNGAFTELLVDRVAPRSIVGVDPSPEQLSYARQRHGARVATFQQGDAMALPIPDASVDAAAMALVIFFVPEPAKGVAEMQRIVRPGGGFGPGGRPRRGMDEDDRDRGSAPHTGPAVRRGPPRCQPTRGDPDSCGRLCRSRPTRGYSPIGQSGESPLVGRPVGRPGGSAGWLCEGLLGITPGRARAPRGRRSPGGRPGPRRRLLLAPPGRHDR